MIVLGIESSCDETAAAIVNDKREILGECVLTQLEHKTYGGVVPEIAARAHLDHIEDILEETFKNAGIKPQDIDAVAAASGPGLIGGVVIGVMAAKSLSLALGKPFIAINHLEGHALAARLTSDVEYPYLLLLVSGGHCQILVVKNVGEFERLGTTIDDAAGEAFDKVAKMLNLGYPGGPMIEKMADLGDENRFVLPRPLQSSGDCNLSFSGLKTAVRKIIESYSTDGNIEHAILRKQDVADICASFQKAATEHLLYKLKKAIVLFRTKYPQGKDLVVSGGVASNSYLREKLKQLAETEGLFFSAPPIKFCTDNGVMIAWAGMERALKGMYNNLDFKPRPRWPLDENAPKAAGAGGVKA
ncbi:MAG: tRNA (adenosine(37)-N6)-threonylcarbamoyltransferase complex transferase subunit TsaD [Alphaproteobacteria bacterium]|nr:tRNA (adenosine(37)-N6)-threonylcarbamoyltransferase complex transferase subunit TsaD [Alphaproteobacteria bacterium]MBQ7285304.1 tRNA (adenosine(37)-N6)-threonylcarbamoyltransferase complex transferase subunit TsaD [Alphaproteobacteria bacterium]